MHRSIDGRLRRRSDDRRERQHAGGGARLPLLVVGEQLPHELSKIVGGRNVTGPRRELGERALELHRVLKAILGLAREGLEDDRLELLRDVLVDLGGCRHLRVAHQVERGEVARAREAALSDQQLVQHDARVEDVAPVIERLAARLLRRHVPVFAFQDPDRRLVHDRRRLRDPEVGELDLAHEGDEDVVRADVAMNDVEVRPGGLGLGVCVVERLAGLPHHEDGDVGRHLSARELCGANDVRQILTVDVLHDDEVLAARRDAEVVNLDDVGVVERRRQLRLVDEHRDERFVLRQVRQDLLDADLLLKTLKPNGLRLVDLGHAALCDHLEDLELLQ